ncbi:hypothetical protein BH11MYX1_BH11MYX1_56860 [soil metagenome]
MVRARKAIPSSALALVGLWFACSIAGASELGDRLATDDPRALAAAITAVEGAPATTPELADLLYAAGRACEDKLADPGRALALYDRLLREQPETKAALGAEHRAAHLRMLTGDVHATQAKAFATLIAEADHLSPELVVARGEALSSAMWPGAAEATLWLADWLRGHGRLRAADAHFNTVLARWPQAPAARLAASSQAGAAIEAHELDRARKLIAALPAATDEDRAVQADLRRALARGLERERLDRGARLALVLAILLLVASLGEAALRGGWCRPSLRPPVELWFLGPIALVLAVASFTANQAVAPAVLRIVLAGVVLAWISGAALDLLRSRGRRVRLRAVSHIALCAIGVLAVAYLAISSSGLVDLLAETLKNGPE